MSNGATTTYTEIAETVLDGAGFTVDLALEDHDGNTDATAAFLVDEEVPAEMLADYGITPATWAAEGREQVIAIVKDLLAID